MNRVLAIFGAASGDSEPYLCHNKCEFGALKAEDGFARSTTTSARTPTRWC